MIIALAIMPLFLNSCREQPKTKTVVVEKKGDEPKGALERTAEKVDDKVNEKIDDQIDSIDDN